MSSETTLLWCHRWDSLWTWITKWTAFICHTKTRISKTFVTYTTQFGSLDSRFKPLGKDEFVTVPDGVAHFLEHKLFEKEEEDLFTAFAEENAQANAFTSFDRTSYLFSATDHLENNIKRLLTMVETPYFTKETVDKEKGIIAEEIKMYQEQPGYKLMFNTLRAMYENILLELISQVVLKVSMILQKMIYIFAMKHFITHLIWCFS